MLSGRNAGRHQLKGTCLQATLRVDQWDLGREHQQHLLQVLLPKNHLWLPISYSKNQAHRAVVSHWCDWLVGKMQHFDIRNLSRATAFRDFTHLLLHQPLKTFKIWTLGLENKSKFFWLHTWQHLWPVIKASFLILCSSNLLPSTQIGLSCVCVRPHVCVCGVCKTNKILIMQYSSRDFPLIRSTSDSLVRKRGLPLSS